MFLDYSVAFFPLLKFSQHSLSNMLYNPPILVLKILLFNSYQCFAIAVIRLRDTYLLLIGLVSFESLGC